MMKKFKNGNFMLIDEPTNTIIFKQKNILDIPYKDFVKIYIKDQQQFFKSLFEDQELGLGESYMNNIWYTDNNIEFEKFIKILALNSKNKYTPQIKTINIFNKDKEQDRKNISDTYDVGNDFYEKVLSDSISAYTCGFWNDEYDTLNNAQIRKVDYIIDKMQLKPNSLILDIGCGWGKIGNYISNKTNSKVIGITISKEQEIFIKNKFNPNNIEVVNLDYRYMHTLPDKYGKKFDGIYSIEMIEHVRYENYDDYFSNIYNSLSDNGKCVIQAIISNEDKSKTHIERSFISKYIFPGGQLPKHDWIIEKAENNGLRIVHSELFGGQHYAKTLEAWRNNLYKNKDYIVKNYSEKLLKQFEYYFAACEAGFNVGMFSVEQFILVKNKNGFNSLNNQFLY